MNVNQTGQRWFDNPKSPMYNGLRRRDAFQYFSEFLKNKQDA